MATSKNTNTNPYYDDFDEKKNYLKILFKPSYAVQARELTQLQTAIQNQITKFGSHIFKDGSIVLGGNTFTNSIKWIDVLSTTSSSLIGKSIEGSTSGAIGKIVSTRRIDSSTLRLYVNYISGVSFSQAEQVISTDTLFTANITNVESFTGNATSFSIEDSTFFTNGYFVFCNSQTIILTDDSITFTKKVGLKITESVVTSADDETLLDPSQGSYNFSAPGADRLAIALDLVAIDFDEQNQTSYPVGDFIEVARFVGGEIVFKITSASYSELETTLARRTYDESGDYTVKAFGLKVVPHKYGDTTKLSLAIDPGKAYVKGYEFETISTVYQDLDKARDYSTRNNSSNQTDFGSYAIVNSFSTVAGSPTAFNFNSNKSVNLLNSGGTTIGTAIVRSIQSHTSNSYRIYMYNVSVTTGSFADVRTIRNVAAGFNCVINTSATEYSSGVRLINGSIRPYIVSLQKSPIKTLKTATNSGLSETSYFAAKTITADFVSSVATIAPSTGEELPSSSVVDYLVVFSNGTVQPVSSVGGTSSSRTITLSTGGLTSSGASIFTYVNVQSAVEKQKVLQNNYTLSSVAITSDVRNGLPLSLSKADCFKLISVYARDTAASNPLPKIDVTQYFTFNNGQTDELYDHGYIKLKSGFTLDAAYDVLDITFSYFTQSTSVGFFSVDSYSGIDYSEIPEYRASTGEVYSLRDCIDFRPRRDDGNTTISGIYAPVIQQYVRADFEYYLSRVDKLVLTKERKFSIVKGISAEFPNVPNDLYDAMTLYVINVPAYTVNEKTVSYTFIDNKRYTMRDIAKIDRRVDRLEQYTVLNLLEQQSKDEVVYDAIGQERFKCGIIADSFSGHSVGDVNDANYSCSINPEDRILRPRFAPYSFNYTVSAMNGAKQEGDLISLPYTTEVLIDQPYATRTVNLNPYQVFTWNGSVLLDPATDTWIDTITKPDVTINLNGNNDVYTTLVPNVENPAAVGVRWNDWQTVNRGVIVTDNLSTNTSSNTSTVDGRVLQTNTTTVTNNQITTTTDTLQRTGTAIKTSSVNTITRDIGTRVVDTSIVPYIRSRVLKFAAKNLKPITNLVATFDGVLVTDYCTPATEIVFSSAVVNRDATKMRTTNALKTATVLLTRNDRVFINLDATSEMFYSGDAIEWYVAGVWVSGGTISEVNQMNSLTTNKYGDIAGSFYIPNNQNIKFRTGERIFRLADAVGDIFKTAAEIKYIASGMSQSVERTIIATRVATQSISPVTETTTVSSSTTNNIVVSNNTTVTDITPPPPPPPKSLLLFSCGGSESGNGRTGTFEYELDFGTGVGDCGVTYNAYNIPDRYTIIWDGKTYSTGFVGSSSYNSDLASKGFPNVAGTGSGSLIFAKNSAYPSKARLIVDAPIAGTGWNFKMICPNVTPSEPPKSPPVLANAFIELNNDFNLVVDSLTGSFDNKEVYKLATHWDSNSAIAREVTYTLTSITSSNPEISIEFESGTVLSRTSGNAIWANLKINSSTIKSQYYTNIVATWTTTNTSVPVNMRTLIASRTATINVELKAPPIRIDPVAQTFYVDANQYPNGIFIKKVDLFFKSKSSLIPVQVQIRPTVNGYPSANTIMPFGVSILDPISVNTSSNGSVATTFEFSNIIHLAPGEYSFVVMADSDEYEIFTARLGEYNLINSNERITRQPTLGSMFKSQNASTWTAEQEEDIKFKIHKCVFPVNDQYTVDYDTDSSSLVNGTTVDYDLFYTMGEVVDFGPTNIDYYFKSAGNSWNAYQIGSNYPMNTRTSLSSTSSDLQFRTVLSTLDKDITPIIDINRLSNVLVRNIVNNDYTNETNSTGGSALARYITRKATLAKGFEASDLKAFLIAKKPMGTDIKVYYRVGVVGDPVFDDNLYQEMVIESSSTINDSNFVSYKYKTPNVISGNTYATANKDLFDVYTIKIVMLSSNPVYVPEIKNLRVIAVDD